VVYKCVNSADGKTHYRLGCIAALQATTFAAHVFGNISPAAAAEGHQGDDAGGNQRHALAPSVRVKAVLDPYMKLEPQYDGDATTTPSADCKEDHLQRADDTGSAKDGGMPTQRGTRVIQTGIQKDAILVREVQITKPAVARSGHAIYKSFRRTIQVAIQKDQDAETEREANWKETRERWILENSEHGTGTLLCRLLVGGR
jgi:hypothetical protein